MKRWGEAWLTECGRGWKRKRDQWNWGDESQTLTSGMSAGVVSGKWAASTAIASWGRLTEGLLRASTTLQVSWALATWFRNIMTTRLLWSFSLWPSSRDWLCAGNIIAPPVLWRHRLELVPHHLSLVLDKLMWRATPIKSIGLYHRPFTHDRETVQGLLLLPRNRAHLWPTRINRFEFSRESSHIDWSVAIFIENLLTAMVTGDM